MLRPKRRVIPRPHAKSELGVGLTKQSGRFLAGRLCCHVEHAILRATHPSLGTPYVRKTAPVARKKCVLHNKREKR